MTLDLSATPERTFAPGGHMERFVLFTACFVAACELPLTAAGACDDYCQASCANVDEHCETTSGTVGDCVEACFEAAGCGSAETFDEERYTACMEQIASLEECILEAFPDDCEDLILTYQ